LSNRVELSFLTSVPKAETGVWASASVKERTQRLFPYPLVGPTEVPPKNWKTIIAIGGGSHLDRVKKWRYEQSPATRLIAIPSIWGSGAEVSSIAVTNENDVKNILMDPRITPDAYAIWPELAATLSPSQAREACGDAWSHALEGFLSPLALPAIKEEGAEVVRRMLELEIGNDPRWFELGAEACLVQSKGSVGLVHGIAHTLEHPLRAAFPKENWGHAKLCSTFLLPVMRLNEQAGPKLSSYFDQFRIDKPAVFARLTQLYDKAAFEQARPFLVEYWPKILRDPCSRTNSSLVRTATIDFLREFQGP